MKTLLIRSAFFCTTGILISSALSAQATTVSPNHSNIKHQYKESKTGQSSLRLVLVRK